MAGVSSRSRSRQLTACERNHTKTALKTQPPLRTLHREEEAGESAPLIGAARSRVVLGKQATSVLSERSRLLLAQTKGSG